MVNRGGGGGGRESEKKVMNMGSDRSKPLHNFTMPPCLKWGNQKVLKCMKVENHSGQVSAVDRRGSASELDRGLLPRRRRESERWIDRKATLKKSPPPPSGVGSFSRKSKVFDDDGDEGIDAFREKLITDLQTEAQRIKVPVLGDASQMKQPLARPPPPPPPPALSAEASRRWNLRSKRGGEWSGLTGGSSVHGGGAAKALKIDERRPNFENQLPASLPQGIAGPEQAPINNKGKRPELSVTLSRQEIEEDFMKMVGRKPHRRPKKRPRVVQKQLNNLLPGMWLSEITPDLYKVPDDDARKR